MEFNKRRRIFYIDKIFQKKLMILFLGLNLLIVAANIVYYFTYLKGAVEDNMFRSHIVISNVTELMAGEIFRFNILLAVISIALVLILYSLTRLRLKGFFDRVKKLLASRQAGVEHTPEKVEIHEEFQEVDQVLGKFFQQTDQRLAEEKTRIEKLKERINV